MGSEILKRSPEPTRARRTATPPADARGELAAFSRLARLLDSAFRVPGTDVRIGLDPIVGLIPGIGDLVSPLLTVAMLWQARRLGVPRVVQVRMLYNVAIDTVLGSVPLIGDLFDFAWKANTRNLQLLEAYAHWPARGRRGDWLFVLAMTALLIGIAAVPLALGAWLLMQVGTP